jgi:hypothetical protein
VTDGTVLFYCFGCGGSIDAADASDTESAQYDSPDPPLCDECVTDPGWAEREE